MTALVDPDDVPEWMGGLVEATADPQRRARLALMVGQAVVWWEGPIAGARYLIAEGDRMANQRAHADMEFLAREMASLRMALGEVATRDYVRSELRSLLNEIDERALRAREEDDAGSGETATDGNVR